ncbi:ferredoxin reductase [Saccharopolyspora erythraea NRRL 2338]|uniref:Ferredoxin reductase n=1 Tax=Saccharopolyspora erythraea (strain ATCC 11635 / DSM 40517 / JCM 4748 / NBRC 13426 / NCIMB 8594 / NRRL 2338) TaxID=405948 RepID=A4FDJ3_SACEN|nr:ferredoxin reductase [Saccharopolyspora erythraea NRRL 2338]
MSTPASVLVVGASAAGLATAEALRRKGFSGSLTVLGDEPHVPYDRPPLSKQILAGQWEPERAHLRSDDALERLDARLLLGDAAVSLDVAARTVRSTSGRDLTADAVVVTTGVRPRVLPGQAGQRGVHVLRSLDDALALRVRLLGARRLVVAGDGVLGAEVAATARGLGVEVVLAGPQSAPMEAQLGPLASGALAELHREHGVDVRPGVAVEGLAAADSRVTGVRLTTGEVLDADVVVVALGAVSNTGWLEDSGLVLENGVVCDSRCSAADGIYAVGDVARWQHHGLGGLVRLENRTNASEQAAAVAANILGADLPYAPVPHFWTDQFAARIQVHGLLPADAQVDVVEGDTASRRFAAVYQRDGRAVGVLGWNMPKQARLLRRRHLVEPRAAAVDS